MKEKRNQYEGKKRSLRKRVEKLLAKQPENLNIRELPRLSSTQTQSDDGLSKTDVQSLIHELRLNQIELEMQNKELRKAQLELEKSRNKYADLYDFAPIGYFTFDEKGLILEVNLTGAALLGIERRYLIKKPFSRYIVRKNHDLFHSYLKQLLEKSTGQSCKFSMLRKDGTSFYAQLEGIAVFDSNVNCGHFRVAMLDITQRRQAEEGLRRAYDLQIQERTAEMAKANEALQAEIAERKRAEYKLRYMSTHDVLTGLYNRAYFEEEMARLRYGRQFPVSIVVVDLDNLKAINDSQGHAAGDELLRRAAVVLRAAFRAEDMVARIGGDEFAVLLPRAGATTVEKALARLRNSLLTHNTAHSGVPLGFCLGATTVEKDGSLDEALKQADKQMYREKLSRMGRVYRRTV